MYVSLYFTLEWASWFFVFLFANFGNAKSGRESDWGKMTVEQNPFEDSDCEFTMIPINTQHFDGDFEEVGVVFLQSVLCSLIWGYVCTAPVLS